MSRLALPRWSLIGALAVGEKSSGGNFSMPELRALRRIGQHIAGVLFNLNERFDLNAQIGIRHVSGLSEVDQFAGTGLEDINNDSGRLTIPVMVGVRIKF